ncbi:2-oxoacid:acceptor oxidoreductase family protein [Desulfovirgula thermocuniculi]|uniref:2-oxoacid:acceptor oxidoreductase family protein n=1 Tax=Desulfovirgula thermocuniculi TaxID=348842 RepID=UPI000408AB95|nr:2-oxoacid:acceptor oxidoreductase family protein [Desulfovirgula thermocuniculi]
MLQIRWHGRGGQGVVAAARLLGRAAAVYEGRYALSFPSFGTERRGAPVKAFTRLGDRPIRDRSQIYTPDCVVVFDVTLLEGGDTWQGLRHGGIFLLNAPFEPHSLPLQGVTFYRVDVTALAREVLGQPLVNTAMVGVLAGITGWVSGEAVKGAIFDLFPARLAEKNWLAAEKAYLLGQELREKGRRA